MIEKLILKNWQAHGRKTVEFDSAVTCIAGASDKGKSAIIRALRYLATNRPAGLSFVRHGRKTATLELHVDGHVITRTRGKKENAYTLDGATLEAFRQDVPEPVAKILQLSDGLNFQRQYATPYWFSESAGELSKRLNELVDLSAMDRIIGELQAGIRKNKARADVLREQTDALKLQVAHTRRVREAAKAFRPIRAGLAELDSCRLEAARIAANFVEYRQYRDAKRNAGKRLEIVSNVLSYGAGVLELKAQAERLADLLRERRTAERDAARRLPRVGGLLRDGERYRAAAVMLEKLQGLFADYRKETECQTATLETLKKVKSKLGNALGKHCPLCGNAIGS